ncbi:MAG TPA: peptidoglycan DD-metalloendopeptidase family protein [Rhodanobacteraceae bacterium]|nr:peptidoglycan DD-metalloendopeptidase family protein [Rhodanobacteraceae bacterium]
MRDFFRYLYCSLLLAAILVMAGAPAPTRAGGTDKQQAATQKKLAEVKKRIAALARQQREAAGKRDAISATLAAQADKLSAASRAVRESNQAIAANQHRLDALEKRRDKLKASLHNQRDALADLLRAAYKIRPGSDLRLLLGDADVAKLSRALAYSRYFQHDRVQHIRSLLKQLHDLDQVEADIALKRKALQAALAQKQQHMAQLADARKQQQALLARVNAQLKDQHQQMRQLERNRQSLKNLLEKLRDVFADIPDKLPSDVPFASRRGKLPWPVHGKSQKHGDGIHIDAARGATIRAVAHGRVAYASWLRGYGLLVVIDHGNGWMSLYGGNESVLHGVGDWVDAGEPIATAGASVGDDAGVYFGLRHKGKPVEPLSWLSKRR